MDYLVSNKIEEFRNKKGITQQELADAIGVSRQTIISIEHENSSPSIVLAMKISRYFQVCVEDIFLLEVK